MTPLPYPHVIEAAGGILWKKTASGKQKIAIIHRNRYNDWSLPKGKREPGETWQETALREVREEIGCQAQLGEFIGSTTYTLNENGAPKVVLFWQMTAPQNCEFQPNDEVDRAKWVSPKKALRLLSYKDERRIVRKAMRCKQML